MCRSITGSSLLWVFFYFGRILFMFTNTVLIGLSSVIRILYLNGIPHIVSFVNPWRSSWLGSKSCQKFNNKPFCEPCSSWHRYGFITSEKCMIWNNICGDSYIAYIAAGNSVSSHFLFTVYCTVCLMSWHQSCFEPYWSVRANGERSGRSMLGLYKTVLLVQVVSLNSTHTQGIHEAH